jgi:organic hydroperoxide reductase OsmC/OhrA
MSGKTSKQFYFETQLNWLADAKGILMTKGAAGVLHVGMAPQFGGEGKPWTPEHLFLSSLSSGFMTTYLLYARKLHFEISGFSCDAIGQIEITEGKYKFTTINLYPKIFIADEALREKANLAMEKTHRNCLVANSVNAEIFYHSVVCLNKVSEKLKTDLYEHSS